MAFGGYDRAYSSVSVDSCCHDGQSRCLHSCKSRTLILRPAVFGMTQFFEVVAWTGAITAFLLATQAMVNPEIKKVLAYSTGSQIGYMMMALE